MYYLKYWDKTQNRWIRFSLIAYSSRRSANKALARYQQRMPHNKYRVRKA